MRLNAERRRMTTFETRMDGYTEIPFALKIEETELTRYIDPMPFVPGSKTDRERRCDEILSIQAMGLKKTSGAHTLQICRDRYLRWIGFYTGIACDGACI